MTPDSTRIREPAVAGSFYAASAGALAADVERLLDDAIVPPVDEAPPKALIVPHAGYLYSGSTAAAVYARMRPFRARIRRVVLLGPVHRVPVRGLALPGVAAFATPLGNVEIDAAAVASIAHLPQVCTSAQAHGREHSLEVQLPFLQSVLDDFRLVPLAVGDAVAKEVAAVLDLLWGGDETLIVVSSDLSHYLPYAEARAVDARTARRILSLNADIAHEEACGGTPINGLLYAARRRGLRSSLVALCNSGDTAGDRQRVVGYGGFVFKAAA